MVQTIEVTDKKILSSDCRYINESTTITDYHSRVQYLKDTNEGKLPESVTIDFLEKVKLRFFQKTGMGYI